MNYLYGFPLFEYTDFVSSYNYLFYNMISDDLNHIDLNTDIGMQELELILERSKDENMVKYITIAANTKRVNRVIMKLMHPVSQYLGLSGIDHGIIYIDPAYILKSHNPFTSNHVVDKLMPYLVNEMRSLPSIWIYFDNIENSKLEQIINLKYEVYITHVDKRTYIQLSPDENFSLIYELFDDIFKYI